MVAWFEDKVVDGCVADDEISTFEVQDRCSLFLLVRLYIGLRWMRHTISKVMTDGLGRVALAMRLVPSFLGGRRS